MADIAIGTEAVWTFDGATQSHRVTIIPPERTVTARVRFEDGSEAFVYRRELAPVSAEEGR